MIKQMCFNTIKNDIFGNTIINYTSSLTINDRKQRRRCLQAIKARFNIDRGLDNAGKTTVLKKFNGEDINTIEPTLGFNIKTLEHREFKLNIWNVGGQKSLRRYWRNYFESTDGLIWVVDRADRRRLADCKEELKGLLLEERLAGATLLVFANKQDLPGALSAEEIKDALNVEAIKTHHCNIQWCSAVTGEKLLDGIDWIISDIASRIFTMD